MDRNELDAVNKQSHQMNIMGQVLEERRRQDEKFGDQSDNTFGDWYMILGEEVGEVAEAGLAVVFGDGDPAKDRAHLREELIQVAAVATAWVEAIDDRA